MDEIDVYGIARLLVNDYGDQAIEHVKKDISNYCSVKEYNSIRKLYEIEEAVRDILEANVE